MSHEIALSVLSRTLAFTNLMWSRVGRESDDYEERDLGEIVAENQIDQEREWGPHTALSDVNDDVGRFDSFPQLSAYVPHFPTYKPASDGNENSTFPYFSSAPYGSYTCPGPLSRDFRDHYDSHPQQGFQLLDRGLAAQSAVGPASMFDVRATHPLFDTPQHQSASRDSMRQSATQLGDHLPDFPNWSRTWYNGHLSADGHAYTAVPPPSGQSGWESESYGRYGHFPSPYTNNNVNDHVKEERIRMLEKEFGQQNLNHDEADAHKELVRKEISVGGFDADGRPVLPCRKLAFVTRCLQCLLSLIAAGCGIGGFALVHPALKAAPFGTLPAFAMYTVSAISAVACLWTFVLKPCCAGSRQRDALNEMEGGVGNMMVPMAAGGGFKGKRKKHKKGKQQQATFVNIILDPAMFLHDTTESLSDSCDDAENKRRSKKKRKSKHQSRTNKLAKLRSRAQWRIVRRALKWECACDVALCTLWTAAAVFAIGFGKTCPAGTAEGWCDLYNGAVACTVLAFISCLVAIYCDAVRLKASRRAP